MNVDTLVRLLVQQAASMPVNGSEIHIYTHTHTLTCVTCICCEGWGGGDFKWNYVCPVTSGVWEGP